MALDKPRFKKLCIVCDCNTHTWVRKPRLFRFPKNDKVLSDMWAAFAGVSGNINLDSAKLCSVHFEKECLKRDLKAELLGFIPMNCQLLQKGSIPTIRHPKELTDEDQMKENLRDQNKEQRQQRNLVTKKPTQITTTPKTPKTRPQNRVGDSLTTQSTSTQSLQEDCRQASTQTENDEYSIIKSELESAKKKLNQAKQYNLVQENILSQYQNIFNPSQQKVIEGGKCVTWTPEDMNSAVRLRNHGPKSYNYQREKLNYPLPPPEALKKWEKRFIEFV